MISQLGRGQREPSWKIAGEPPAKKTEEATWEKAEELIWEEAMSINLGRRAEKPSGKMGWQGKVPRKKTEKEGRESHVRRRQRKLPVKEGKGTTREEGR